MRLVSRSTSPIAVVLGLLALLLISGAALASDEEAAVSSGEPATAVVPQTFDLEAILAGPAGSAEPQSDIECNSSVCNAEEGFYWLCTGSVCPDGRKCAQKCDSITHECCCSQFECISEMCFD